MLPVGVVLTVTAATGSLAIAGAVAAALEIGAAGGVLQSRLIDRTRQTPFLLVSGALQPLVLIALALGAGSRLEPALLIALGLVAGLAYPQITACLRSILADLDDDLRRLAFSLDAILIEGFFLVGPAAAALILAFAGPGAIVYAAAALTAIGTLGFVALPASRHWRGSLVERSLLGPWSSPGLRLVLGAAFVFGLGDGLFQLAVFAYAEERAQINLAPVVFALFTLASVIAGALYGARRWPGSHAARLTLLQSGMAIVLIVAASMSGSPLFIAVVITAGLFLSPLGIETSLLVDADAPAGTTTEAFAWLTTVVAAGNAIGLAAGGQYARLTGSGGLVLGGALLFLLAAGLAGLRWQHGRSLPR